MGDAWRFSAKSRGTGMTRAQSQNPHPSKTEGLRPPEIQRLAHPPLGITQDSVSRLEKRSDLLLSTLRKTVKAMGGDVRIVAEFPDRAPVVLSGIADDDPSRISPRKRVHAHS